MCVPHPGFTSRLWSVFGSVCVSSVVSSPLGSWLLGSRLWLPWGNSCPPDCQSLGHLTFSCWRFQLF